MKGWFEEPGTQRRLHQFLKYFWFGLAVFSITPWGHFLTNSIAVIFFISVYANFVSHWSTERAIDAQLETRENNGD